MVGVRRHYDHHRRRRRFRLLRYAMKHLPWPEHLIFITHLHLWDAYIRSDKKQVRRCVEVSINLARIKAKGLRSNVDASRYIVAYCTSYGVGSSLAALRSRGESDVH